MVLTSEKEWIADVFNSTVKTLKDVLVIQKSGKK